MSRKADKIDAAILRELVSRYPSAVPSALNDLDEFRYEQLPQGKEKQMNKNGKYEGMKKADLQRLVEWKLRHGTFRPSLAKLVASNDEKEVLRVTSEAFIDFSKHDDADTLAERANLAVKKLTSLKGVGPATASLILSCFDSFTVPFFSDELYRWLHWDVKDPKAGGEWSRKIKYTAKEYASLLEKVGELRERLASEDDVGCIGLEKAAYVLGKEEADLSNEKVDERDADRGSQKKTALKSAKRKNPSKDEEDQGNTDQNDQGPDPPPSKKRSKAADGSSKTPENEGTETSISKTHSNSEEEQAALAAWQKHISQWPKRTAKEKKLAPGTKAPKEDLTKSFAEEDRAIAQGQKNPVYNRLGYVYNVKALRKSRQRPTRSSAAQFKALTEAMKRQNKEEEEMRKFMGWKGDPLKLGMHTKLQWKDRVARDLDVPFHCVDLRCYEEWHRRGNRLEEGEYDEKMDQVEDDRLMYLSTGSGLVVGYYDNFDGKHRF